MHIVLDKWLWMEESILRDTAKKAGNADFAVQRESLSLFKESFSVSE